MDCSLFPTLPDTLVEGTDDETPFAFNTILLKACDPDPDKRFQSAAALEKVLLELLTQIAPGDLDGPT